MTIKIKKKGQGPPGNKEDANASHSDLDTGLKSLDQAIKKHRRRLSNLADIRLFLSRLAAFAVVIYLLFFVFLGITTMPNDDMLPRVSFGDLLLYYRMDEAYSSGNVVAFRKDGTSYVGRVIGKGGDEVEVTEDGNLIINGSTQVESGIYFDTRPYDNGITGPVQLKENEYYILCDHREGATDSRVFGAVTRQEIQGKVITIVRRSNL